MKRFIAVLLAAVLAGGVYMYVFPWKLEKTYPYSQRVFGNPLMGYAPCAWYQEVEEDVQLLYMDITWRELEPEEGVYAWEAIEEENQLKRWREEGKHIVLRFVCDIPGEEAHLDIPDWLYEKTGGAGTHYDHSYGRGFAPDYAQEEMIRCHARAVAALGARYGKDGFISFVELGSLGHWGEWHVRHSAGIQRLPDRKIREQYVTPWLEAFPNAWVMMRRPFAEAEKYGLGLFNDMAGHPQSTKQWLEWIEKGGEYDQTGEKNAVVPMQDFWKTAPVGGELTSSLEMEQMLSWYPNDTAQLIRESHTTFLGPKIGEKQYREGYDALLLNMGYRLMVSRMQVKNCLGGGVRVELTWENRGAAPFYGDWAVELTLKEGRSEQTAQVDLSLPQLLPGEQHKTVTWLPDAPWLSAWEDASLWLGILDPMTGKPCVEFAMEGAVQDNGQVRLICLKNS